MLKYIGDGSSIVGIPARDLTDAEVEEAGGEEMLLASGLYVKPAVTKAAKSTAKPADIKPAADGQQEA
jgi:hypothetical protein